MKQNTFDPDLVDADTINKLQPFLSDTELKLDNFKD